MVELYTSEGCNSCPPADRWLSKLKADPTVVALAFHVDYWDRLGWKDRFASAAFTARQAEQQASNGARFSYTPQVVVDGRDRTDWSRATVLDGGAAGGAGRRSRSRARATAYVATVTPAPGAPQRLAAYWAVTEQGHVSAVKAGENEGVTLHHDFVVRDYEPVAAWSARAGAATTLRLQAGDAPPMRRIRAASTSSSSTPRAAGRCRRSRSAAERARPVRSSRAGPRAARRRSPACAANGSVGLRACTMSSSRVCTLASAFGWL